MRRMVVAVLVALLATAAGGCGGSNGSNREHDLSSRLTDNPWAAPSPSQSPPPPPLLVDYLPKPVNQRGYPACGFYTQKETVGYQEVLILRIGVAVVPEPPLSDPNHSRPDLAALYTYDTPSGTRLRHTVTFDGTGAVSDGGSFSLPGASFYYVTLDVGVAALEQEYYSRTTTVTVTVDSKKGVVETNESNNSLSLKVRPTKRGALKITDNKCTVAR
jgi:hypothetical protein